jgi:hypothetical protein
MMRDIRCSALMAFTAVWLTACAPAPTPRSTPASSPRTSPVGSSSASASAATIVSDATNGISFQRPAAWTRWQPNQSNPINGGPLMYLTTDPLLPTCATAPEASPNPPDAQGLACDWPLASLSPNGVLVTWVNNRILAPLPNTGEVFRMNGDRTRLQIERPGACQTIGADETVSVLVPIGQPTPLSNIAAVACLRGPDLTTAEAQVRAMLGSATLSQ